MEIMLVFAGGAFLGVLGTYLWVYVTDPADEVVRRHEAWDDGYAVGFTDGIDGLAAVKRKTIYQPEASAFDDGGVR